MITKYVLILALVIPFSVFSQEEERPVNRLGLIVEYGLGGVALKDQYISKERYTGTIPFLGVYYGRLDERKGYQLGFTFQKDNELENFAIRAEYMRASLNFDQFFTVKSFLMAGKEAAWHIGPSVEYFEYELTNRFSSNHKAWSELIMASVGINTLLDWQFGKKFTASAFLRSNVIGMSYKTHDERKFPDKNSILQTLVTANNLDAELAVRYKIVKRISLGLKGRAQYTRSTGWDDSNCFVNSLTAFTIIHF